MNALVVSISDELELKEKYPNSKWILRNIFVGVLINLRAQVSLSHGSWRLRSRLDRLSVA